MNNQTLAKLQSPVTEHVVIRKRLFHLLDQARKKKSAWVTGLPGAGKTTLVASYLASNRVPHAWYHLDSSDADPATFFYYLRHLALENDGTKKNRFPLLTPEYLSGIRTFAHRYFENLYAALPRGGILVFDNYHEVEGSPAFHTVIREALKCVPEYKSMILISRTPPPPSFSELISGETMEMIDHNAMKFTPEETHEFVHLRLGDEHGLDTAGRLHSWTDGWAAGIVLMLAQETPKAAIPAHNDFQGYQSIFDYFSSEIFNRLEPLTQDFLLKTCFFPSMTVAMADRITGSTGAGSLLSKLAESQYFTVRHQNGTYSYHDLFRKFLISKVTGLQSPALLRETRQRAAMVLEKTGYLEDAVSLFIENKAWKNAGALIVNNAQDLIAQGRHKTMEAWINNIPKNYVHDTPWLTYWLGMCKLPFSPRDSSALFERVFNAFTQAGDKNGIFMAWTGAVYSITYRFESHKLYDPWIKRMEHLMCTYATFPSPAIAAAATYAMLGALVFRQPFNPGIKRWIKRGRAILEKTASSDFKIQMSLIISLYYIFIGDFPEAGAILGHWKGLASSDSVSSLAYITLKDMEVVYNGKIVDPDPLYTPLYEGLRASHAAGIHALDPTLLVYGAAWALGRQDIPQARRLLEEASRIVRQENYFDADIYYFFTALEAMFRRDFSSALVNQTHALASSLASGTVYQIALNYLQMAQILHALSRDKEAYSSIQKAARSGSWSSHIRFMCFAVRAAVTLDQGKRQAGLALLRKALHLGSQKGYINFPGFVPSVMAGLCVHALNEGIQTGYVRDLIRKRDLFPDTPPYTCEDWPWPLRISTLGRFEYLLDDTPEHGVNKVHGKLLELLQLLISHYDRSVDVDSISSVLWPDAPGDYAHQTLDVTIHRLRKLLGTGDAVLAEAGRLMINPKVCWLDVQAFGEIGTRLEALLQGLDPSIKPADRHARIRDLGSRMLRLYQGDFFAQEPLPPWAIGFRETLRDRFTAIVEMLGAYYEKKGDRDRAVTVYEKGLNADERKELFYQRLMLLYHSMGRRPAAAALYRRCAAVLIRTLGIEPSRRTREIFERISRRKIRG